MIGSKLGTGWILVAALALSAPAAGEEGNMEQSTRERDQIDEVHRWKIEDLYPSIDAWEKDIDKLERDLKAFGRCEGTLKRGAKRLAGCLEQQFDILKRYYRLSGYAQRLHHQDARQVPGQELKERIGKVGTELQAKTAWVEPEILDLPPEKLAAMRRTKVLQPYDHVIDNIVRRRAHVLDAAEEQIIARAGDLAGVPQGVYQTFATINLPFPEVELADGQKVELTQAMYSRYRAAKKRQDRIKVFEAFWGTYTDFRETFAGLLSGAVKRDHFHATVRRYDSDLAAALDATNVPTSIYTNMIAQIKKGLPLLWRYLKLRKQQLGLDELGYHDLYTSIVPSVEMSYDWQAARELIMKAMAPLGEEYLDIMRHCFDERWTDVYPTMGKRSGAYMSGSAYDVHPYVLLNFNDDYESVSTAAHEFGHAAHSFLANANQPFHDAQYPIFTAEVASTAAENLLRLHVTEQQDDPDKQLYLLGQYLESWRQTVFRQCLFAEFELEIHRAAAAGEPLTADLLDRKYLELLREYYGEAEGVIAIDPLYAVEWSYIPHFYYNFYMFQYTTSFIASTAIAEKIAAGDEQARRDYLSMLKAGGSKYPVELLKMAGVDMIGPEPYQVAFKALRQALDAAEALVAKKE